MYCLLDSDSSHHPYSFFPPNSHSFAYISKKYKLLREYIFKSRSSDLFVYMFHTVCSNITVRTELGLLYNINESCYFAHFPMSGVKFLSRSCLNDFSLAEIGQWVVGVLMCVGACEPVVLDRWWCFVLWVQNYPISSCGKGGSCVEVANEVPFNWKRLCLFSVLVYCGPGQIPKAFVLVWLSVAMINYMSKSNLG